MKKPHCNKIKRLLLAATLSAGLGFVFSTQAFAEETHSYIVDLNSKTIIDLGTLGGIESAAWAASTTPGRWWVTPSQPRVLSTPSSPAPTGWA